MSSPPSEILAHPVERSTGLRGRILDPLHDASMGATIGSAYGLLGLVLLGIVGTESGLLVVPDGTADEVRTDFVAGLILLLGLCIIAALLSGERVLRYARVVGEALWNDGRRATPVPPRQHIMAIGESPLGKAFIGSLWLGVLLISCSAFVLLAAITFLFDNVDTGTVLMAVGSAAVLAIGIGIFFVVRLLRRRRARLLGNHANTTRVPPDDVPVFPVPRSSRHCWGVRLQTLSEAGSRFALATGMVAFGIWALTTGDVSFIGGSIRVLPETLKDDNPASAAQSVLESTVMLVGIGLVMAALVLWVVGFWLSLALHISTGHLMYDLVRNGKARDARPDPRLLTAVLETPSPLRRMVWFAGAAAAMVAIVGSALSSVLAQGAPSAVLGATLGALLLFLVLDALSAERIREFHNLLWRTWPHATSPGRTSLLGQPPAGTDSSQ